MPTSAPTLKGYQPLSRGADVWHGISYGCAIAVRYRRLACETDSAEVVQLGMTVRCCNSNRQPYMCMQAVVAARSNSNAWEAAGSCCD